MRWPITSLTANGPRFVLRGRWPEGITEEVLGERIGPARRAACLNFRYGVTVEEALQLAFEEEVHKEKTSRVWGDDVRTPEGEAAMQRLYGASTAALVAQFSEERPDIHFTDDTMSLSDLKEFTYWLFKYRVKNSDPARVASDTRRGLILLSQMEYEAGLRRKGEPEEPSTVLETSGWVVHNPAEPARSR